MLVMFKDVIASFKEASLETRFPEALITGTFVLFSIVNHTLESCCEKESREAIEKRAAAAVVLIVFFKVFISVCFVVCLFSDTNLQLYICTRKKNKHAE